MREFVARKYDGLIAWLRPARFFVFFCFLLWLEFHLFVKPMYGYYTDDLVFINVPIGFNPYYGIHGIITTAVRQSYYIGYLWANAMFLLFWALERRNLYFREHTITNPDYHLVGI